MFISRIAELNIKFLNKYKTLYLANENFIVNTEDYDITISVSDDEILNERNKSKIIQSNGYFENICACRNLCLQFAYYNAFLFHSAFFRVENRGIALAARSGTGKTTHLMLWKNLLNDELVIINGDKPIFRRINNKFIGYGTPWCGKEHYGANICAPITDICFIKRNEINYVQRLEKNEALNLIMQQIFLPYDRKAMQNVLSELKLFIEQCNLWSIYCNTDIDAARIAYDSIIKNKS